MSNPGRTTLVALTLIAMSLAFCGCSKDRPTKPKQEASSYKGPKVLLKPKLRAGDYSQSVGFDFDTKISGGRSNVKMTMNMLMEASLSAEPPAANGNQIVKTTFDRVKTDVDLAGTSMSYDSSRAGSSGSPLAAGLAPLVGWTATLTFADDNTILKAEGLDELMSRVKNGPGSADARESLKGVYDSLAEGSLYGEWEALFPKHPVGPGDRWQGVMNQRNDVFGDVNVNCNVICQDIRDTPEGKVAIIDFIGTTTIKNKTLENGSGRIEKMDMWLKGRTQFNLDLGTATEVALDFEADGDMRSGGERAGMDIEGTVTFTMSRK
jgi:Family of unknown function (DUF6263)